MEGNNYNKNQRIRKQKLRIEEKNELIKRLRTQLDTATKKITTRDKTITQLTNHIDNIEEGRELLLCPHCNRLFTKEDSKHNDW